MLPEQDAVRGGLYMAVAMAAFTANDTLVKLLGDDLPVSTLIFVRGGFACFLIMIAVAWSGSAAQLPQMFSGRVALRALLDTAATLLFISAADHHADRRAHGDHPGGSAGVHGPGGRFSQ